MANFLVIAASSAIGQATVRMLEADGHRVFKTARTNERIHPDILLDASDFNAVDDVFKRAVDLFGAIDGVVNFAGSLLLKPAHLTTAENYDDVIKSSLATAFATVRSAGKYMKGGSVVLMSSAAHAIGLANHEAIAAAKAGVVGLALSAAATYADANLRFNVVCPGLTETPLTERITKNDAALAYSLAMHPLKRVGQPDDIARAITFLLNPDNSWITGQVLSVDGGLSKLKTKMS
ncbi:MAG: SDR family oxidoreductase [Alphaproteobacteria bacterium]|jgi:3-oxoacyl-[acyl-carrier protein] reductase|nr:SDR family oxidoreductase [Alphaproteobacteria bacterium]